MRKLVIGAVIGLAASLALVAPVVAQKTQVNIYTSLENDQLAPFKAAIEAAVPGSDVLWTRDSTGVITARFLAEKDIRARTWSSVMPQPRFCC